jgi:Thiopurine S-methyltransferase (TPMT)
MKPFHFYLFLFTCWGMFCALVHLADQPSSVVEPSEDDVAESAACFWRTFWQTYRFEGEPANLKALQIDTVLKKYWRRLCPSKAAVGILVPLAGTGDELEFLEEMCQPEVVFGVELDPLPISVFYQRLLNDWNSSSATSGGEGPGLTYITAKPRITFPSPIMTKGAETQSTVYCLNRLCYLQADFLQAPASAYQSENVSSAPFDALFDRRAFSAIAPALRQRYVAKLDELSSPSSRMLITILLRGTDEPEERRVAPFPIIERGVFDLFGKGWVIEFVGDAPARLGTERVYLMTKRA